ncbi:MAG: hypothetical protein JWL71_2067 [Acidobacteria bacterium]|nr:hypothetical protein [Acidobacteriota bacterium]
MGTDFDNRSGAMGVHTSDVRREYGVMPSPEDPGNDDTDEDSDDAPETPLDEPRPPRVQDPPPEPGKKGPYVVRA